MTVATINSTVSVVVASELGMNNAQAYAPAIAKVSEALEAREYDIVDAIVDAADSKYGVGGHEVRAILTAAGLSERPAPVVPEPVAEPVLEGEADEKEDESVTADDVAAGKRSKAQRLAKLEEDQAQILSALGSLGQSVTALKALAERHLGASL